MEGKTVCDILTTINTQIIVPARGFLFVLAGVLFLYGVVEYIAGSSNDQARTTGKQHMIWGLAGLAIMLAATAIVGVFQNFFPQGLERFCTI